MTVVILITFERVNFFLRTTLGRSKWWRIFLNRWPKPFERMEIFSERLVNVIPLKAVHFRVRGHKFWAKLCDFDTSVLALVKQTKTFSSVLVSSTDLYKFIRNLNHLRFYFDLTSKCFKMFGVFFLRWMTTGERKWSLFYRAQRQSRIGITENQFASICVSKFLLVISNDLKSNQDSKYSKQFYVFPDLAINTS